MGGSGQKVTLPSGKEASAYNGDRGFFVRGRHTLKCLEGWKQYLPWKYVEFSDKLSVGKREFDIFPSTLGVSKNHITVACLNNYYFIKDAGSKQGTYIRIGGSSKNKRIELHKGMSFAVGRMHFKISLIEGDAADNRVLKAQLEQEAAEKMAKGEASGKKKEDELESDEEFADDSDDDDGGSKKSSASGKKRGKLDGPAVMFLSSVDKKLNVKGRIRETSTIGADKEKNKISLEPELAKDKLVDAVHTRICLEDGRFYLEDAGSKFGTWVGLPKKRWFEVNVGDSIMLGSARCRIGMNVNPFQPLQGMIDKLLGASALNMYALCPYPPIE